MLMQQQGACSKQQNTHIFPMQRAFLHVNDHLRRHKTAERETNMIPSINPNTQIMIRPAHVVVWGSLRPTLSATKTTKKIN